MLILRKRMVLFALLAFTASASKAQTCPSSDITFTHQTQIDVFQSLYPFCSVIPDGVNITITGDSIYNLGTLAQINVFLGRLEIHDCPQLVNLNGLQNVTTIGNDTLDGFVLRNLPLLDSVKFLTQLSFIQGEFTIQNCASLKTLIGLKNLSRVNGSVVIRNNAMLQNVNGLDSLNFIGESLEISNNAQLTNLAALSNIDTIRGTQGAGLVIENNNALTNLLGFGHDTTAILGNLTLESNGDLAMCAVPSICNYLANPPAGAVISITGNTTGCNTQAQVNADCAFVNIADIEYDSYKAIVSPNPITDRFRIIADYVWHTAEVFDASGRKLQLIHAAHGPEFDFWYQPGIYFFKISGDAGIVETVQVVK